MQSASDAGSYICCRTGNAFYEHIAVLTCTVPVSMASDTRMAAGNRESSWHPMHLRQHILLSLCSLLVNFH